MEKNKDKEKTNWKELIKDPKVRALTFFGFYFVFFAILIVMIRTNPSSNKENIPTSTPTATPNESISNKRNYQYIYTVVEDGNTIIYSGKAYQNKELFTMIKDGSTSSYYRLSDHFLKKTGDQYLVAENPYLYADFFDLDLLTKLLEYNISNTKSNQVTTYQVDSADLFDVYFPSISYDGFSISEVPLDQIVVTRNDEIITKVEFSLDHMISYYSNYVSTKHDTLTITIELYDFGEVADFEI